MSHFSVGVLIKEDGKKLEELLAPYQDNNMGDCPKEYLKFIECDKDEIDEYEEHKDEYNSLEEFMEEYHGYEYDVEIGKYGYWENPNSKWDWYQIGGRWNNMLKTKDGKFVNEAMIKDVDFSMDQEKYNKGIRFWELYIEKGFENLTIEEKDELGFVFYKPSYFLERYKTKENYAKIIASFSTYAVLDNDGEWYEPGPMGWFGVSGAKVEDESKWDSTFYETFIENADENMIITIVDCHI